MEFDFSKFVDDIEKRKSSYIESKEVSKDIAKHDRERRLRDARYFEKWQNRIVWEEKKWKKILLICLKTY